jgi:hypothetical protein
VEGNFVFFTSTVTVVYKPVPFSVATPSLPICTKNAAALVAPVFARCTNSVDVEIQQRAAEYSAMREAFSPRLGSASRDAPPFRRQQAKRIGTETSRRKVTSAAVVKASRPSAACTRAAQVLPLQSCRRRRAGEEGR